MHSIECRSVNWLMDYPVYFIFSNDSFNRIVYLWASFNILNQSFQLNSKYFSLTNKIPISWKCINLSIKNILHLIKKNIASNVLSLCHSGFNLQFKSQHLKHDSSNLITCITDYFNNIGAGCDFAHARWDLRPAMGMDSVLETTQEQDQCPARTLVRVALALETRRPCRAIRLLSGTLEHAVTPWQTEGTLQSYVRGSWSLRLLEKPTGLCSSHHKP